MTYTVRVVTRRNNGQMQVAVDFPSAGGWSDDTSQNAVDMSVFKLMLASGTLPDWNSFNQLASGTYPTLTSPAVTQTCLLGYEVIDDNENVTFSNMDSQIGADMNTFLTFIAAWWSDISAGLVGATNTTMTRADFITACLNAVNTGAS